MGTSVLGKQHDNFFFFFKLYQTNYSSFEFSHLYNEFSNPWPWRIFLTGSTLLFGFFFFS